MNIDWRKPIIQHVKCPLRLSKFEFQEELGITRNELPNYFFENGEKRRIPNRDIKMCISQTEGIKWLAKIHEQRIPHLSMDEIIPQVAT